MPARGGLRTSLLRRCAASKSLPQPPKSRWPAPPIERDRKLNATLSIDEALYLAKEAGFYTTQERQLQIVRSPPFSPRESPFLLENFFQVADNPIDDREDAEVYALDGRVVALQDDSGKHITADRKDRKLRLGTKVDDGAKFNLTENLDGTVSLKTSYSSYVAPDGQSFVEDRKARGFFQWDGTGSVRIDQKLFQLVVVDEAANLPSEANAVIHSTIQNYFRPDLPSRFWHQDAEWLVRAEGRGTRKRASAHAVIVRGTGIFKVNGEADMFTRWPLIYHRFDVCQPFKFTGTAGVYDVFVETRGGGVSGQAGATRLAVARALLMANPACHDDLQRGFCLLEDTRQKMSKMPGRAGRNKGFPWNKR